MTSDPDKYVQVAARALHHWHVSSKEAALVVLGVLLVAGVMAGAGLAVWIFRGGWSRRTLRG